MSLLISSQLKYDCMCFSNKAIVMTYIYRNDLHNLLIYIRNFNKYEFNTLLNICLFICPDLSILNWTDNKRYCLDSNRTS